MITRKECDEARFLGDVGEHAMQVLFDDGERRRQLRFKKANGSSCYYFDLVTWPGTLCITGDMGSYTFQRLEDMFDFFRMSEHDWNRNPNGLSINPGYWSEKLVASSGHTEWDGEAFGVKVEEFRDRILENAIEDGVSEEERQEISTEIDDEILYYKDDEHLVSGAVHEFSFTTESGHRFDFGDFFCDGETKRFTFHFLWCCYAISWGINQYDAVKAAKP